MNNQTKPQNENIEQPKKLEMSSELKALFEERKKAKREPLTREKLRKTPGLENLTDEEADEAIDSIKRLATILFDVAVQQDNKDSK